MISPDLDTFRRHARPGAVIALHRRIFADQLTPVLAYRRMVKPDERTAPSFLFESVENGTSVGRYSMLGARPAIELIARGHRVELFNHETGETGDHTVDDPLSIFRELESSFELIEPPQRSVPLPDCFRGGWVGYAGYDTVRYLEPDMLPFANAPQDDRALADMHFGLYRQVVVFDHVDKLVHVIVHIFCRVDESPEAAYERGADELASLVEQLERHDVRLPSGQIELDPTLPATAPTGGNFSQPAFEAAVRRAGEYIAAGDAFQIVLSQRFDRRTSADPFDIYRALRVVNPSPYMIYLQATDSIMVASSPEILCRVHRGVVTSRPLAGTRRRGRTPAEDAALEADLLGNEKERAEHIMLVDLARNDLGRVCEVGSITLGRIMDIERYSHVMHISSTVTGRLRAGLGPWDALRVSLPVGTVSGAPKVRAMQIIDELEPTRRGPYGGGIGAVGFDGNMDIALALRTMVIPHRSRDRAGAWRVDLQAGAGIVADSQPAAEYEETVNKAAALGRAIDLAEAAFVG